MLWITLHKSEKVKLEIVFENIKRERMSDDDSDDEIEWGERGEEREMPPSRCLCHGFFG